MNDRPLVPIRQTRISTGLDAIALLGLVVSIAIAVYSWSSLPETIPIHFGINGRPDGWGNKLVFWIFPWLNLAIVVGFTFLRRYPHTFNYPVRITPENAEIQYAIAIDLLNWFKAEYAWLFVWIEWQIANALKVSNPVLDPSVLIVLVILILATAGLSIYRAWQNR